MLREQKKLETRARLYQSALDLFRKHGYDAVSVEEIAKAAGTAKGTFFNYFESKVDVIAEWYSSTIIGDAADRTGSLDETISSLIQSGISLLESDPILLAAKMANESNSPAIMAADRVADSRARDVLIAAMRDDPKLIEFEAVPHEELADLILIVLTGAAHAWRYSDTKQSLAEAMELQTERLKKLIYGTAC